uniref:Methyl transferase n=1 Tax=Plasmopara viticola lesion associated polymycovirus 2 TaxID=2695349 RepID=A0A6B9QQL8_9VIRU|nr:methyl transferase [Plasmopara viticola lesion associated polymycovirus 2]
MQRRSQIVRHGTRAIPSIDSRLNSPAFQRRTSEVSSSGGSLAYSYRSRSSALSSSDNISSQKVLLPYPLFEFGYFSPLITADLPGDTQFENDAGHEFMASPAGTVLRHDQGAYARMTRELLFRAVRITGASIVILGSGASREMIPLLRRGPRAVTFVDTDIKALERLQRLIDENGLAASSDFEFVNQDAWDYLLDIPEESIDVILATKCLGQVLIGDDRTFTGFLDRSLPLLSPDGHILCDHHVRYATKPQGEPIIKHTPKKLYDLATIGGRYDMDVCYSCDTDHPDFSLTSTFFSSTASHMVQVWEMFLYRARNITPLPSRGVISTTKLAQPATIDIGPPMQFDATADQLIPINARGVKRIPATDDINVHSISTALPKFDGFPGILLLDGPYATFISPRRRWTINTGFDVAPRLSFVAELVSTGPPGTTVGVIVITGVTNVGDAPADPLDYSSLSPLRSVLSPLASVGILITSPDMMRYIVGDSVVIPSDGRPDLSLPIDGFHVLVNGRSGVFFKPSSFHSLDLAPSSALDVIRGAYSAMGYDAEPSIDHGRFSTKPVVEYSRDDGTDLWRAFRSRPDKKKPDGPGAVVHSIACSKNAEVHTKARTVEELRRKILR